MTLILLGDEAWTEEELRDALEHPRCGHPVHRALTDADVADIVRRYQWNGRHGRVAASNIAALAAEYGVSQRTIERYIAAHRARPLPCPGPRCLTRTPGGRLCQFCSRTVTA